MDSGIKAAVSPNRWSMANESINAYSSSSGDRCNGIMGVPITFLDKYNPDQFEIIGLANDKRDKDPIFIKGEPTYLDDQHKSFVGMILNGKATYARIIIKRKGKPQ